MKQKWRENLKHPYGLDYVELVGVPMRRSKREAKVDLRPLFLERLIARAIVTRRIPIRGKEVKLLRAAAGLSLDKFARRLGITSGAVFHWEKAEATRLMPINEAAVRALCAEELAVDIPARFSELIGIGPERLTLDVSRLGKKRASESVDSDFA